MFRLQFMNGVQRSEFWLMANYYHHCDLLVGTYIITLFSVVLASTIEYIISMVQPVFCGLCLARKYLFFMICYRYEKYNFFPVVHNIYLNLMISLSTKKG